jgi:hypothetical protein
MNHTHHNHFFGVILDVSFGILSVMFAFISYSQIESTLILSAIGGIFSVLCGGLARVSWRKVSGLWSKKDKRTKKELLAYIKELEEKLEEHEN